MKYFLKPGRGCDFLSDQKVTKESPGGSFDERLRGAGAHKRRRPPAAFWLLCRRGQSNHVFLGGQRPPLQMIEISPTPRRAEPQKQSEALQKVLLPTILTRKVGALVPGLGRERLRKRFVVPPNFRTGRPCSLSPLCCGRGDHARFRARW